MAIGGLARESLEQRFDIDFLFDARCARLHFFVTADCAYRSPQHSHTYLPSTTHSLHCILPFIQGNNLLMLSCLGEHLRRIVAGIKPARPRGAEAVQRTLGL